jgi:hypothetical protein
MIVTHKSNGNIEILGSDQEKLLANILHYVIAESEVYSAPVMRINVENLKNALGV